MIREEVLFAMKILVTGGAGFIGSHVVEHYQGRAEIVVLDNLRSGYRKNLDGFEHEFVEADINDADAVAAAMRGVDVVMHLAAMISVPESMDKPRECTEINGLGVLNVLQAAVDAGVGKLIHASSAAVYGDNPAVPKTEDMLPEPQSPYAVTKLDGEYYLEIFRREYGLSTTSVRFFNVFGPRQDPRSPYAAAVPIFCERALAGVPLTIFGDGTQTRDFVYVKEAVAALDHLASDPAIHGTHNVGYGTSQAVRQLAEDIIRAAGSESPIEYRPKRKGDVMHSRASVDKLIATGFRSRVSLRQGLAETLEAFRSAPRG